MSNKREPKLSQITTFVSGDVVRGVRSNQSINFTYQALFDSLSGLSSFNQVGDPTGTPILEQPSAGVNNIRNLESSKGVITSVSAQNGAKLACNFTQSATGTPIIPDLNADQYTFKTLVEGNGISFTDDGESVQINFSPDAASTKTVVISQESDFPAPIAGVITLEADTDYLISTDISTSNRFVVAAPNTIRSSSSQMVTLEYTGSGDMFTGTDPNFKLVDITVNAPNGNIFNTTSVGTGIVQMIESNIESCQNVGTMDGNFITRFSNVAFENIIADGLSFTGSNNILLVDVGVAFLGGGSLLDLGTATFNTVSIISGNIAASAPGTFFLSGAAASANINSGGLGAVINNNGFGSGTALNGITVDDARWNFQANNNIPDTRPDSLLSFTTPTTTVLAAATPALITGTWTVERTSQMDGTAAGRATYNGEKNATLPITATVSLEPVSGTNKDVNVYVAKNGSIVANSKVFTTVSSGSPKNQSVVWQDDWAQNDYYEVWIESVDGTDVQVNTAKLRVN